MPLAIFCTLCSRWLRMVAPTEGTTTCRWCGFRPAAGQCDEGLPACKVCFDPDWVEPARATVGVPKPPVEPQQSLASRVFEYVKENPGCAFRDLCDEFEIADSDSEASLKEQGLRKYNAFGQLVRGLALKGCIRLEKRRYYPIEGAVLSFERAPRRAA